MGELVVLFNPLSITDGDVGVNSDSLVMFIGLRNRVLGGPKAKSSPTLINVILKSTAKDLISIFLQTADSDCMTVTSISCGFQVLNSTLRTTKYLSTGGHTCCVYL